MSWSINNSFTPEYVTKELYKLDDPECDGTVMSRHMSILSNKGFEVGYLFSYYDMYGIPNPKPISFVAAVIRDEILNGYTVLVLGNVWSEISNKWLRHFFWVVDVDKNGNIYVMDSWKGFGKPYPLNQNTMNPQPKYISAIRLKKL